MENDRRKTLNSGDTTPEPTSPSSSDFEFRSLSSSSSSPSDSDNSPADHLFLNGRLLPHTFPTTRGENTYRRDSNTPRTNMTTCNNVLKMASSSMSNKEETSLTCFVPRSKKVMDVKLERATTCSIKGYDYNHHKTCNGKTVNTTRKSSMTYLPRQCKSKKATEIVTAQLYGVSSRQWQHITPVFKRQVSVMKVSTKKKTAKRSSRGSKVMKWLKKVFKVVVIVCRECHAMEPLLVNDNAYVKRC